MNKPLLIGFIVVLAVVLGVPLLAGLKKKSENEGPSQAAPAEARDALSQFEKENKSAPAAPDAPPLLNEQNLIGTTWVVQGFQVQLNPGGQAFAPSTPFGPVQGTWSVSGSKMTVTAMGRTFDLQISGDKIYAKGQPIQRIS